MLYVWASWEWDSCMSEHHEKGTAVCLNMMRHELLYVWDGWDVDCCMSELDHKSSAVSLSSLTSINQMLFVWAVCFKYTI